MSKKHHDCCCESGCDMCCESMLYPQYNSYPTNAVAQSNNYSNGACGWNIWTIILALIILQCSGILCNNRAYVLLLLFWFCGFGGFGFGGTGCGNNVVAAPASVAMPCCC